MVEVKVEQLSDISNQHSAVGADRSVGALRRSLAVLNYFQNLIFSHFHISEAEFNPQKADHFHISIAACPMPQALFYQPPSIADKQNEKIQIGTIFYVFLPQTQNMKKLALIIVVALITGFAGNADAQKPFKGILTYTITYDGTWDAATLAQQPTETKMKILGKYSKSEMIAPGATVENITNGKDSSQIVLLDIPMLGEKYYMLTKKDKILESLAENKAPEINYLDETKVIAGYTCNKAEYITEDEYGDKKTTVVYYSTAIGGPELNFGGQFTGLKGFPMEYVMETDEGKITFTVSTVQVKKVKLKETDFYIPTDYSELTEEKAKELFGGE